MERWKRWAGVLLCLALLAGMSACSIPKPGFADYDVSGYVQALLDSSYHDSHEALKETAGVTEESARANNTTTVENAAVLFCNTYGISPSEEQLQELQVIMKQAFALTRYTVKEERKVDTGYYLEVEIASITNFEGRSAEIEKLKAAAQSEATNANTVAPSTVPGEEESGDNEDGDDENWDDETEDGTDEDGGESSSQAEPAPQAPGEKIDANALFVDKVLDFCKQELANISYDPDTRSMPLDIRQTDQGELQLDMEQIEKIDATVVRFSK